jgi:hypothetical protein
MAGPLAGPVDAWLYWPPLAATTDQWSWDYRLAAAGLFVLAATFFFGLLLPPVILGSLPGARDCHSRAGRKMESGLNGGAIDFAKFGSLFLRLSP